MYGVGTPLPLCCEWQTYTTVQWVCLCVKLGTSSPWLYVHKHCTVHASDVYTRLYPFQDCLELVWKKKTGMNYVRNMIITAENWKYTEKNDKNIDYYFIRDFEYPVQNSIVRWCCYHAVLVCVCVSVWQWYVNLVLKIDQCNIRFVQCYNIMLKEVLQ